MVRCFKKPEITIANLKVSSYDRVKDFYVSTWQPEETDSAVYMLVLRVVLAVFATAILLWTVVEAPTPYWLLYLTNWGLVLLAVMFVSGTVVCVFAVLKKIPPDTTVLPWYISTYWVLYNISITMAFLISALYWILLFDPDIVDEGSVFYLDLSSHGLNSVLAFIELTMSRTPVVALHFYQPLCCGVWYAAFTFIYYLCDGTDMAGNPFIYEILDWSYKKRSCLIVFLSVIGLLIIWFLVNTISYGRDKISDTMVRPKKMSEPSSRRAYETP